MHSIIKDLHQSVRPKSMGKSMGVDENRANLFVPFEQERDKMGRLIRSFTAKKNINGG